MLRTMPLPAADVGKVGLKVYHASHFALAGARGLLT